MRIKFIDLGWNEAAATLIQLLEPLSTFAEMSFTFSFTFKTSVQLSQIHRCNDVCLPGRYSAGTAKSLKSDHVRTRNASPRRNRASQAGFHASEKQEHRAARVINIDRACEVCPVELSRASRGSITFVNHVPSRRQVACWPVYYTARRRLPLRVPPVRVPLHVRLAPCRCSFVVSLCWRVTENETGFLN